MNTQFKFTQKNIAALPPHPKDSKSTDQEYSDTLVSGLKLLVGKSGNKKFLFRYSLRSRKCSTALGSFGALTVDEARIIANQHKALVFPFQHKQELIKYDKLLLLNRNEQLCSQF